MAAPPEHMVCRTCARVLDWFEPADQTGGYWRHTSMDGGELADHQPDPVEETEIHAIYRCDFCNTDESAYILPVNTFTAPTIAQTQFNSDGDWSACIACGRLIDLNQWTALLRRVKQLWERRNGPMAPEMETKLSGMYRLIRKNQKGSLRPFTRPHPPTGSPGVQDGQHRVKGPQDL